MIKIFNHGDVGNKAWSFFEKPNSTHSGVQTLDNSIEITSTHNYRHMHDVSSSFDVSYSFMMKLGKTKRNFIGSINEQKETFIVCCSIALSNRNHIETIKPYAGKIIVEEQTEQNGKIILNLLIEFSLVAGFCFIRHGYQKLYITWDGIINTPNDKELGRIHHKLFNGRKAIQDGPYYNSVELLEEARKQRNDVAADITLSRKNRKLTMLALRNFRRSMIAAGKECDIIYKFNFFEFEGKAYYYDIATVDNLRKALNVYNKAS